MSESANLPMNFGGIEESEFSSFEDSQVLILPVSYEGHHSGQRVQSKYGEYGGNFVIHHAHQPARTQIRGFDYDRFGAARHSHAVVRRNSYADFRQALKIRDDGVCAERPINRSADDYHGSFANRR